MRIETQDLLEEVAAFKAARELLHSAAMRALSAALIETFANAEVETVVFGVSSEVYNDENAGQGVFGPVVNGSMDGPGGDLGSDGRYELFYDRSPGGGAPAVKVVLDAVGWEELAAAFGFYDEGQEVAFIAERDVSGNFSFRREERGW